MNGIVCDKCGNASNEPRRPKCERADCPGREVFVHMKRDIAKCFGGQDHEFTGWRDFDDGTGGEQVCQRCGVGAMAWTLRVSP